MKHLLEAEQESIPDMADPIMMDEELINLKSVMTELGLIKQP